MVVFGVWLAIGGAVAVLAGLASARRRRRLQSTGRTAWAMVLPTPSDSDGRGTGSSGVSVQFTLDDGRVIERAHGPAARRSRALSPGERVLVWYDPADPGDIMVYGRDGRWSDRAFLVAGAVFILAGIVMTGVVR